AEPDIIADDDRLRGGPGVHRLACVVVRRGGDGDAQREHAVVADCDVIVRVEHDERGERAAVADRDVARIADDHLRFEIDTASAAADGEAIANRREEFARAAEQHGDAEERAREALQARIGVEPAGGLRDGSHRVTFLSASAPRRKRAAGADVAARSVARIAAPRSRRARNCAIWSCTPTYVAAIPRSWRAAGSRSKKRSRIASTSFTARPGFSGSATTLVLTMPFQSGGHSDASASSPGAISTLRFSPDSAW